MVIQYKDATTYVDLLVLFDHLGARLHALRQRLPYGDEDARNVGLRGMQVILAGYAMDFSSMIFERTQADIIRTFGRSTLSPDEARQIENKNLLFGCGSSRPRCRLDNPLQPS